MNEISVTDIPKPDVLLATSCSPASSYAWPLYDDDPSPSTLCGADLTAPALLSYPIPQMCLREMGWEDTPYSTLVEGMAEFVSSEPTSKFSDLAAAQVEELSTRERLDPIAGGRDWQALIRCLDAVWDCEDLTTVAVTKILHRKRSDLVPINDSLLREFYRLPTRDYDKLFVAIRRDLGNDQTKSLLASLTSDRRTPSGRPMTDLRALDIVVWMHMRSVA